MWARGRRDVSELFRYLDGVDGTHLADLDTMMSTLEGASPELRSLWEVEWSTLLEAPLPPAGVHPHNEGVVSSLSTSASSAHYSTVADAGGATIQFLSVGAGRQRYCDGDLQHHYKQQRHRCVVMSRRVWRER